MYLSFLSMMIVNGSSGPVDIHRLALELSSAEWFKWVTWYGYAVAFGCAMEVWEVCITLKNWWLFKSRNIAVEEDKGSLAYPIAAFGLVLIVAGIVLETYCEGKAAGAETELRDHFSKKLTAAENEAASATRDAGTAKNSSTVSAASAKLALDESNEAVEKAKVVEGNVVGMTAKANEAAETAESAGKLAELATVSAKRATVLTAAVEDKYSTRTLSSAQRNNLIFFLDSSQVMRPIQPIQILAAFNVPDGVAYGAEIADAINGSKTGWKAQQPGSLEVPSVGRAKGVFVTTPNAFPPAWVLVLNEALESSNVIVSDSVAMSKVVLLPQDIPSQPYILICRKN